MGNSCLFCVRYQMISDHILETNLDTFVVSFWKLSARIHDWSSQRTHESRAEFVQWKQHNAGIQSARKGMSTRLYKTAKTIENTVNTIHTCIYIYTLYIYIYIYDYIIMNIITRSNKDIKVNQALSFKNWSFLFKSDFSSASTAIKIR